MAHFQRAIAQLHVACRTRSSASGARRRCRSASAARWPTSPASPRKRSTQVYARARDLCRQTGDTKSQFIAEWNLWHVHVCRAEHRHAQALGERLMAAAEQENDPELLLQAHHVEWIALGAKAEHRAARPAASGAGRSTTRSGTARTHLTYGAHDPGVCSRNECAHATVVSRPAGPGARLLRGRAGARAPAEPPADRAARARPRACRCSSCSATTIAWRRRQRPPSSSRPSRIPPTTASRPSSCAPGLLSGRGEPEQAVRLMQAGLQEHRGLGAMGITPYYMSLLARAQARCGCFDEALATLDAAHRACPRTAASTLGRARPPAHPGRHPARTWRHPEARRAVLPGGA